MVDLVVPEHPEAHGVQRGMKTGGQPSIEPDSTRERSMTGVVADREQDGDDMSRQHAEEQVERVGQRRQGQCDACQVGECLKGHTDERRGRRAAQPLFTVALQPLIENPSLIRQLDLHPTQRAARDEGARDSKEHRQPRRRCRGAADAARTGAATARTTTATRGVSGMDPRHHQRARRRRTGSAPASAGGR